MAKIDIDLNPITHITVDAIGDPGERVFYLQGRKDDQVITLLIEKIQVQMLVLGFEQFMEELKQKFPDLTQALPDYDEKDMLIFSAAGSTFQGG